MRKSRPFGSLWGLFSTSILWGLTARFNGDEWETINYKFRRHSTFDNDSLKEKLSEISKALERADFKKAYTIARKEESSAYGSEDEAIFNIYAHLITVYRKRKEVFTDPKSTEMNSLVKIWGEIFETLLPDDYAVYCKWGESKAHNNEAKIDCRMIHLYDKKEVDLIDLEAARYMVAQKIDDDHLKLSLK
ncbi:unnamed protein product [Mucor hiemalis]